MRQRFTLFRRANVFYCEDTTTHQQASLRTKDEGQALALLHAKNEAFRQSRYLSPREAQLRGRFPHSIVDEFQPDLNLPLSLLLI
jgi:hypothetical protein